MEKTQAKPLTAAQQRQRDKKRRTWLRTGVQLFFFVSMPGAFVAGFSGVKQIFLHIGAGEVLSVDSFTLSLLGLCGFCSNRSVMLRRLMPRVERLCSMALVAGGKDIFPLLRSYSVTAQTRAGRPVAPSMRG